MFRTMSGSRAAYHHLTLLVISEFNEWHVMVQGPGVTIQGRRQFKEDCAKQHAVDIARQFIHDRKHDDLAVLTEVEWTPTAPEDWLIWSA